MVATNGSLDDSRGPTSTSGTGAFEPSGSAWPDTPVGADSPRLNLPVNVLDQAPVGMMLVDGAGIVQWSNAAAQGLFGLTGAELVATSAIDLVHPDDAAAQEAVNAALAGTAELRGGSSQRWQRADGSTVRLSVSVSAAAPGVVGLVPDPEEVATCAIIQLLDVTEQHDGRVELGRVNEELRRSNDELERFAYIASHDLQEPLRVVSGHLQLLARKYQDDLDEDAHRYIDFAVDAAGRMRRLIEDLLRFSRVNSNRPPLTEVDLYQVAVGAVRSVGPAMRDADASVEIHDLPTVRGDAEHLSLVLTNLFANALKYRSTDRPTRIEVRATRLSDAWEIAVDDNGIGIAAEHRERVFELFRRLHGQGKYEGSGLGLAICRKIVEGHGGEIRAEAGADGGTSMRIVLAATPEPTTKGSP